MLPIILGVYSTVQSFSRDTAVHNWEKIGGAQEYGYVDLQYTYKDSTIIHDMHWKQSTHAINEVITPYFAVVVLPDTYTKYAEQIVQPFAIKTLIYESSEDFLKSIPSHGIPIAVMVITDIQTISRSQLGMYSEDLDRIQMIASKRCDLFLVRLKQRRGDEKGHVVHFGDMNDVYNIYRYQPLQYTVASDHTHVERDIHWKESTDTIQEITGVKVKPQGALQQIWSPTALIMTMLL